MLDATGPGLIVGPSILSLVTSGIYDNPLAIYREYIQNAVDALSRMDSIEGQIEITIDRRQSRVSICDNGPGLTYQECLEDLVPIARSKKCLGRDRGFRGIGRLSGLAFAECVTFLTRASGRDPVARVVWTKPGPGKETNTPLTADISFPNWVKVETLDGGDYPDRFFRVELDGVSRHSAQVLLDREAVRGYIAEVCPVPLASDFRFFEDVQTIFPPQQLPYSLRVTLDGEEKPIHRQYASTIGFAGNKEDHFQEFEEVHVPSVDGRGEAAIGWIAHSSYFGAIPKGNRIRGMRARVGNIQVGDEKVFDHLFEEERFNRWCVGEVHILDYRVIPNGRRDYFERNPHLRNLENHLTSIFRQIVTRCRAASSNRHREKRLMSSIVDIEALYEIAVSGCLSAYDAQSVIDEAVEQLAKTSQDADLLEAGKETTERLASVEIKLRSFQPNDNFFPLPGVSDQEANSYRKVFAAVAFAAPSPHTARQIINAALNASEH